MMMNDSINMYLDTKAELLASAHIKFGDNSTNIETYTNATISESGYTDNHHLNPWVFIKFENNTHVRMTLNDKLAKYILLESDRGQPYFKIIRIDNNVLLVDGVVLEKELVHCPDHLFLGLYEYCSANCYFCPLSIRKNPVYYSIADIFADLVANESSGYKSIGITTGIPPHKTSYEVGVELADVVRKIRKKVGASIPIGVSTKLPSKEVLRMLHDAGASEARLNLEIYDYELSLKLMPNKSRDEILKSIHDACEVFGHGKVSSNIILGIGESDSSVIEGVENLASIGAIATLYPYDPVPEREELLNSLTGGPVGIPTKMRLIDLANKHKEILNNYKLRPQDLKTMCPACAASHILPGIDL